MFGFGDGENKTSPESYMLESISAASLAKKQVAKVIRELGDEVQNELEMEMFEIIQSVAVFSELTETEVEEITAYCKTIMPLNNDSLEMFASTRFNSAVESPRIPTFFPGDNLALQAAMIETISGFYDRPVPN